MEEDRLGDLGDEIMGDDGGCSIRWSCSPLAFIYRSRVIAMPLLHAVQMTSLGLMRDMEPGMELAVEFTLPPRMTLLSAKLVLNIALSWSCLIG